MIPEGLIRAKDLKVGMHVAYMGAIHDNHYYPTLLDIRGYVLPRKKGPIFDQDMISTTAVPRSISGEIISIMEREVYKLCPEPSDPALRALKPQEEEPVQKELFS